MKMCHVSDFGVLMYSVCVVNVLNFLFRYVAHIFFEYKCNLFYDSEFTLPGMDTSGF